MDFRPQSASKFDTIVGPNRNYNMRATLMPKQENQTGANAEHISRPYGVEQI